MHKLKVGVATVCVQLEKIHHAEFAEANFKPSRGQPLEEREWRSRRTRFLSAQRNNLMPHQPRDVRCSAQCRISHDIEIRDTPKPQCFTDSVPPALLHITKKLGCVVKPQTGK